MDIKRLLETNEDDMTPDEALVYNLIHSQMHAQQALDLLYNPKGTKRSLWYRLVLARAQSILMSLLVRELGRKEKPDGVGTGPGVSGL